MSERDFDLVIAGGLLAAAAVLVIGLALDHDAPKLVGHAPDVRLVPHETCPLCRGRASVPVGSFDVAVTPRVSA